MTPEVTSQGVTSPEVPELRHRKCRKCVTGSDVIPHFLIGLRCFSLPEMTSPEVPELRHRKCRKCVTGSDVIPHFLIGLRCFSLPGGNKFDFCLFLFEHLVVLKRTVFCFFFNFFLSTNQQKLQLLGSVHTRGCLNGDRMSPAKSDYQTGTRLSGTRNLPD